MDKDNFIRILQKSQHGDLTKEEQNFLNSYYNLIQDEPDITETLNAEQIEELKKSLLDSVWSNVSSDIPKATKVKLMDRGYFKLAAASVVFLILAVGLFYYNELSKNREESGLMVNQEQNGTDYSEDILPGTDKATLTLANGSIIDLDSVENGTLSNQGNIKIIKGKDGQLLYRVDQQKSSVVVFNTISTPRGGKYEIVLADGSKVWLNAASSLKFPTSFSGKTRDVILTGEGYFEVAKNADKPFRVSVSGMQVEVLGTHFNVNAYNDENMIKTTLLEGSVRVISEIASNSTIQSALLMPGEQADYTMGHNFKIKSHPNLEEVVAWKNGNFEFNNTLISDIMRQISRWYDVEIVYEGSIPANRLTGKISRNVNLSQIIEMIHFTGIEMKIKDKKVTIWED